ncbi:MAG: glycosyltransferase family 39 protein [Candidatus Omnitrophica bacterium]|nr:glycosyltransferase family 39 protein [Candidatus Omnitrophota bacterium]
MGKARRKFMTRKAVLHFIAAAFLILAPFIFGWLTIKDISLASACFTNSTVYFMALLVFIWFWAAFLILRKDNNIAKFIHSNRKNYFLIFIFILIICLPLKPNLRVLSDESNLVGVSRTMSCEKKSDQVIMGMVSQGKKSSPQYLFSLDRIIPKRPPLFPFLVAVVHIIRGYRVENVFIVNFIVLYVLICLIFTYLKNAVNATAACAAAILIVSHSIFIHNANSGGYDLLYIFLMCLSFISLDYFLTSQKEIAFRFLWINLLLLLYIRNESFIYAVLTFTALFFIKKIPFGHLKEKLIYFCTPLLLLPFIWHKILTYQWILAVRKQYGTSMFGWAHFLKNNIAFIEQLLKADRYLPFAIITFNLSLLCLIWLCVNPSVLQKMISLKKEKIYLYLIAIINFLTSWVAYTSYFWGAISSPPVSRLYMLPALVSSVISALFLTRIFFNLRYGKFLVLLLCSVIFFLYFPNSTNDNFYLEYSPGWRVFKYTSNFLKNNSGKNILLITDKPDRFVIYCGAVSFQYANPNKELILSLKKGHILDEIYVAQKISAISNRPISKNNLDNFYKLETVAEQPKVPVYYARISRVIER